MRLIITLFIVVAAIVVSSFFDFEQFSTNETQENVPQKQSSRKQALTEFIGPAAIVEPKKPVILINTYITAGPEEGEIIEETNRVIFEFEAKISPKETEGRVSFETKIEGLDDDWQKTSSQKRIINLPLGPKEYTFLVRAKIKDLIDSTPAKRTFKINVSPYFGKIKISRVKPQISSRPSLITLRTYLEKEEKINITGWRTRGRKGNFIIRQGIEKYSPLYGYSIAKDILIRRGDTIYLINDSSPLGGNKNFRLNKCFGYLLNSFDFYPSFSKNCPLPNKLEEISHLNEYCQEFILHIRRCEIPDYFNDRRIRSDLECRTHIDENFNYWSCFKNYSRDEDFLKNYWYIYSGHNIVSELHDTLYLRDQNGLLVDKYIY